jgi:hypothetical protein
MKTTCPNCQTRYDIPEKEILQHITRSEKLRSKVASLLGRLTGGHSKLDAEARRERAKKAVQARENKRRDASVKGL